MGIGLDFVKEIDKEWKNYLKPLGEPLEERLNDLNVDDIKTKMIIVSLKK